MDFCKVCLALTSLVVLALAGVPQESGYAMEEQHAPMPYEFGYKTNDGEGTKQQRHETADESGKVKGFYAYNDPNGLYRRVEYTADKWGFQAVVKSNEPGTANQDPAAVQMKVEQPPEHAYPPPAAPQASYSHHEPQHFAQPATKAIKVHVEPLLHGSYY